MVLAEKPKQLTGFKRKVVESGVWFWPGRKQQQPTRNSSSLGRK
jgi:hypothetical protein